MPKPDRLSMAGREPHVDTYQQTEDARAELTQQVEPLPWHLLDLDSATGGVRPGWFTVIGARPANGKTAFLLNWLNRLHDEGGHRIMYLSTELPPQQMYTVWAAHRLGYEQSAVLEGRWHQLPPEAREKLRDELLFLGTETQTWMPKALRPSLRDLQELVARAVAMGMGDPDSDGDVLILDHLHRMRLPSGAQREGLEEACRTLSTLATERGIAVVAACQLRREEHGVFDRYRPPHLGSFMGSSAIEQEASQALGLYRPLKPMTTAEEREVRNGIVPIDQFTMPDVMACKILKHRYRGHVQDRTVLLSMRQNVVGNYSWRGT